MLRIRRLRQNWRTCGPVAIAQRVNDLTEAEKAGQPGSLRIEVDHNDDMKTSVKPVHLQRTIITQETDPKNLLLRSASKLGMKNYKDEVQ